MSALTIEVAEDPPDMKAGTPPQAVETLRQSAMQAIDRNDLAAAYKYAGEILQQESGYAIAHAILAHIFETRHDLAVAQAHARASLDADPANALARIALAQTLLRERKFEEAEAIATPLTKSPEMAGHYAIMAWTLVGKSRDRIGDAKGAFDAFTASNRLLLRKYSALRDAFHPAHPNSVRAMKDFVESIDISDWRAPASSEATPAFLIGFPRSGTTLLDQILSSHSQIVCLEERPILWEAIAQVMRDGDGLERIAAFSDDEIETIRESYWGHVRQEVEVGAGQLLIDRQPLHVVLLPLIKRVFPQAKFIVALREPRDVVLSCYEQSFSVNVAMAQFWELERAAAYYDVVMELYSACRARLQLDVLEVHYRDVVLDLEATSKRLAAFLGLSFERAMLDHTETARGRRILTASSRQVVEPIYTSSLARWRRYAEQLAPVLPVLEVWAQRLGYEV